MFFLVTRTDALHDATGTGRFADRHKINSSEFWPVIVQADNHEQAVEVAYNNFFGPTQKLPTGRQFLVVHLVDAEYVTAVPKNQYDFIRTPFTGAR